MAITSIITAITALTSSFVYIPVGFLKVFPIQHLANVLSAVILGPTYTVAQALMVSIIRNAFGTGSIFAFPGSLIGAFLAAVLYRKFQSIRLSCLGEVCGTGFLGSIACYPLSVLILGEKATIFGFMPAFLISSLTGSLLAFLMLKVLLNNPYIKGFLK